MTNTTRARALEAFEAKVRPTIEAAAKLLRDQGLDDDAAAVLDADAREAVDAYLSVREAVDSYNSVRRIIGRCRS